MTTDAKSLNLGAGFRHSTYGPKHDPGAQYWQNVGLRMAKLFPGATPETVWIVGELDGKGTRLSYPGSSDNPLIHYTSRDLNETALSQFDESGVRAWLQVEPGDAPVDLLIHLILERYGHHPCVIGAGVDMEWFHSYTDAEGVPVTDAEAAAWLAVVRSYNSHYRLFLKHWETEKMPPTQREGLFFIDDSQMFQSLEQMAAEFADWGQTFAPAPVGFQFGYPADRKWWGAFDDPAGEIGRAILGRVPNMAGLYWVDFTVLEVFKP
jgi:hypothetical protein